MLQMKADSEVAADWRHVVDGKSKDEAATSETLRMNCHKLESSSAHVQQQCQISVKCVILKFEDSTLRSVGRVLLYTVCRGVGEWRDTGYC